MTKKKAITLTILTIILVAIVYGGIYLTVRKYKTSTIPTNERQAVFLTNGQVYFGNIVSQSNSYVVLKGVYYLSQNQTLQPGTTAQTVDIIKLGSELQGPEDVMYISRQQVLFYENMRNDSKVNLAIQKFISSSSK